MALLFESWLGNVLLILMAFMLLVGISMLPGLFLRLLGRVGLNCFWGALFLLGINSLTLWSGVALPLNGLTLAVAGVLGGPGMVALAVLNALPA